MDEVTMKLHSTDDAQVWAEEWCKSAIQLTAEGKSLIDEGWMISWFANAIEIGKIVHDGRRLTDGTRRIIAERRHQIDDEMRSIQSDSQYIHGELTSAAISYAMTAADLVINSDIVPEFDDIKAHWPWGEQWYKPSSDPIRNLEKAGGLIAAEIDRLVALRDG